MTADTPRDPLAVVVHAIFDEIGWFDSDCADWQSDTEYVKYADDVATRLRERGVTLDATRPSGDEALLHHEPDTICPICRYVQEHLKVGAPLATPSSAPDVEGLARVQRYTITVDESPLPYMELDPEGRWCLFDEIAALRDSRSTPDPLA